MTSLEVHMEYADANDCEKYTLRIIQEYIVFFLQAAISPFLE